MKILENVPLSPSTTFAVGGPARYFINIETREELQEAIKWTKEKGLPLFVLGGGSNIVVSDDGFPGVVVRLTLSDIQYEEKDNEVYATIDAGVVWNDLVVEAVNKNFAGIECLSGIPGSAGGAVAQNIGAYGQEIKDSLVEVEAFDVEKEMFRTFTNDECQFEYRDSFFKSPQNLGKFIVFQLTLKLVVGGKPTVAYEALKEYLISAKIERPTLDQVREAVLELRQRNHIAPSVAGNAGSIFKNPVVDLETLKKMQEKYSNLKYFPYKNNYKIAAGWLIETAGWKGKHFGSVQVSPKHALVIINPEKHAKASEIMGLIHEIQKDIKMKFGINLEREVLYVG
jgi:UDP-N-acetylmuramate dehydrogenase